MKDGSGIVGSASGPPDAIRLGPLVLDRRRALPGLGFALLGLIALASAFEGGLLALLDLFVGGVSLGLALDALGVAWYASAPLPSRLRRPRVTELGACSWALYSGLPRRGLGAGLGRGAGLAGAEARR